MIGRTLLSLTLMAACMEGAADTAPHFGFLLQDSEQRPALAGYSIIVLPNNAPRLEEHAGVRAFGAPDLPVNGETLFRVASISKLVTALGFMKLVEQGQIGLDDDVSGSLGFVLRHPSHPDIAITPRMLLTHTSHLRDGSVYSLPVGQKLRDFFTPGTTAYEQGAHFAAAEAGQPPAPGQFFSYANLNFGVLATVMERISGQRFDRYMQQTLLEPLGLQASFNVRTLSDASLHKLSALYRRVDGQWQAQVDDLQGVRPGPMIRAENPDGDDQAFTTGGSLDDYVIGDNGTLFSPQGGLRINTAGLARIASLMLGRGQLGGKRFLSEDSIGQIERVQWRSSTPPPSGETYGGPFQSWGLSLQHLLGGQVEGGSDAPWPGYQGGWMGHLGEAYGLLSGLLYNPQSGDAIIYVINGLPDSPDAYPGQYSSFYRWEEELLSRAHEFLRARHSAGSE